MTFTAKSGYGYWDVTQYPYGGYFRRLNKDTKCEVIESYPHRSEAKVKFPDSSIGVIKFDALIKDIDNA